MYPHRLSYMTILLFLAVTACSWALEIGDPAPNFTVIRASDHQPVKRTHFHGKSNIALIFVSQADMEFIVQLQSKAESFKTKYDSVIIPIQPESRNLAFNGLELYTDPKSTVISGYGVKSQSNDSTPVATFLINKSGHIRWIFRGKTPTDRPAVEELESELAKLKREKPLSIGSPAPDFSLIEADGKTTFTLSDYKGKKNVLVTLLLQTY
jgi:peroxiredoxin